MSVEQTVKKQRRFNKLLVKMRVYNVVNDEEIRSRIFDYNDFELRGWYQRTVIWALLNSHAIELVKADADA